MDYRRFGETIYIRLDRGDEVVASIADVCEREGIQSATFLGIGGCDIAQIQVFNAETGAFETETYQGLLELVSLTGNVIWDPEEGRHLHAHALFAYRENDEPRFAAGHLKSTTVRYTAEIELHPVVGGTIGARRDAETGTHFWSFD